MINIILASHGDLAKGILMSAQMIVGKQTNIELVTLNPNDSPSTFKKQLIDKIDCFEDKKQILFLVDLWGGTPFNQISTYLEDKPNYGLITGLNLGMLCECLLTRNNYNNVKDLIQDLIQTSKEGINSIPEVITNKNIVNFDNNLKKGHIEYVLARIDSRLLHGQIATGWSKVLKPNRIIVVSDKIAHDNLRKNLIKRAAPADIKAHIVPISKLKEIDNDERFGGVRALLLFETVEEALKTIEAGVKIDTINLGSIAHQDGKVIVSDALSMDQKDLDCIYKLLDLGIKINVRKTPSDNEENLDKILAKAKASLKEE